jgi:hypothetical protein
VKAYRDRDISLCVVIEVLNSGNESRERKSTKFVFLRRALRRTQNARVPAYRADERCAARRRPDDSDDVAAAAVVAAAAHAASACAWA